MKNLYVFLLKVSRLETPNSGFTLIELIAASIMTLFIVGAAGFGMTIMLREQTMATAGGDIQYNLNRAVDFISEEVRSATSIVTDISSSNLDDIADEFTQSSGKNVILVLNIAGLDQPVIYYSQNSSSPWLGPKVIRRWGPEFTNSGGYSAPSVADPSSWVGDVLIDGIDNTSTAISCPSGWSSINPTSGNTTYGFFACVNPANPALIQLNILASAKGDKKVQTIAGNNPDSSTRFGDKATYSVSTLVYSRSKAPIPLTSSTTSGGTFSAPSSSANATFVTSGCPTTFFPASPAGSGIDIDGTTTNITANGTVSVIISGTSLNLTPPTVSPALTDFTFTPSTNGGTFTSGSCTVVASLST